jgi:enamine deaminase RidA (YjgF/YER057c/UK114 family)
MKMQVMNIDFPRVPSLFDSPNYSAVAVVPPGATWVLVGGQNAVDEKGAIVGGDDVAAQAGQVRKNLEAALAAAGCDWKSVVRVTVIMKAGVDARQAFAVFGPALAERSAPPLVVGFHVAALARPGLLLEVGLEAVR